MSNLFGNLGQNTSGNVFGDIQPTSTSTGGTGGLFGNATTTPGGKLGAPATTGDSLLGNNIGALATGGLLFGAPVPKLASTGSLFGGANNAAMSAPAPAPAPGAGSLFGGPTAQNLPPGQSTMGQPIKQNSAGLGRQTAHFNSLLEKNKKRTRDGQKGGYGDVPSLQLGLGDISKRVRELGGAGLQARGDRGADSRAHYLLAASGVNPGTTLRDLATFTSTSGQAGSAAASLPPDFEPETDKYIHQLQQRTTRKMMAESLDRANSAFDEYVEEHVSIDWEAQRNKIYEHFGLTPRGAPGGPDSAGSVRGGFGRSSRRGRVGEEADSAGQSTLNRSVFGRSGAQKSVIGTPGRDSPLFGLPTDKKGAGGSARPPQDDSFTMHKQQRFAMKVQHLNEARLEGIGYPVFREFLSVETQMNADTSSQILDSWKALGEMVQEEVAMKSSTRGLKPRAFAEEYMDETPSSQKSASMRKRIINGSRRALEKQFYAEIENLIARNPREASLGGVPTVINKVRAYVRLRHSRKDLVADNITLQQLNEDFPWALIFFLLRTGYVDEIREYVSSNHNSFAAIDRNFVTYIDSYCRSPDRRLPRMQQEKINSEYASKAKYASEGSVDPYRMACYKVVGRCDLQTRSITNIALGVEGWTWLQFALARESNKAEELASEVWALENVQQTIREIGQRHFSKGSEDASGYGTFFYLQILGGMFEQAVYYLYQRAYVTAVHFAIGLAYYGLLRVADFAVSENELLTYTTREQPQISFGRMIGYYTRDFRTATPVAATDYLTLICLNADLPAPVGRQQAEICHEALRELVLETCEYSQLLGDIKPDDGVRIAGSIEQRLPLIGLPDKDAFLKNITLQAAAIADDNGRTSDAVLLCHLAEDYDTVITIINRALSEDIAIDDGFGANGLQALEAGLKKQAGQPVENTSASLASIQEPILLATKMIHLYNGNAMCYQKIHPRNREVCGVLLQIAEMKMRIMEGKWAEALRLVEPIDLIPFHAHGSMASIRSTGNNLNSYPPAVTRLIGPLVLWTCTALSQQRHGLNGDSFENGTREVLRKELKDRATDLMTYVGLIKLKMPRTMWDELGLFSSEFEEDGRRIHT